MKLLSMLDGASLTIEISLRAFRAGCQFLGLSKRGSKHDCMKRMFDDVHSEALVAAHGAEVRLTASDKQRSGAL